ncbi:MAG: hypothetical protein DHS80DRAFT_21704 [Piptocephalis tieghemiana]|nr:MAG: hypothetical protein DHS80DRAFT_21704 [Piptocephalis tieghemiana]
MEATSRRGQGPPKASHSDTSAFVMGKRQRIRHLLGQMSLPGILGGSKRNWAGPKGQAHHQQQRQTSDVLEKGISLNSNTLGIHGKMSRKRRALDKEEEEEVMVVRTVPPVRLSPSTSPLSMDQQASSPFHALPPPPKVIITCPAGKETVSWDGPSFLWINRIPPILLFLLRPIHELYTLSSPVPSARPVGSSMFPYSHHSSLHLPHLLHPFTITRTHSFGGR